MDLSEFSLHAQVLEEVDIATLAETKSGEKHGRKNKDDGYMICDIGDIVEKYLRWQKYFPRIHPYFAMKACPHSAAISCIDALGGGFDCASQAEIEQALGLGVNPNKIIYANPFKQTSHIEYAKSCGVNLTVFDDAAELEKIQSVFPEARLVLRLQTDDSTSTFKLSSKFGAPESKCRELLLTAKEMNLNVVGVCFHIGSGCRNETTYIKSLEICKRLIDFAQDVGFNITLLDIGGGFPGTGAVQLTFENIGMEVSKACDTLFPSEKYDNLRIIAEPGRYFSASAFTLATSVIVKRKIDLAKVTKENPVQYVVTDGIYGTLMFSGLRVGNEMMPFSTKKHENEKKYPSMIWGPTLDALDVIKGQYLLPDLNVGEYILWRNMGAYTISNRSDFNGMKTKICYNVISAKHLQLLKENSVKELRIKLHK